MDPISTDASPPSDHKANSSDARINAVTSFLRQHDSAMPAVVAQLGADVVFETAINGDSMAPSIPGRARLRLQTSDAESCRVGDVVLYLSEEGYMAHRIVYRPRAVHAASYILTQGDNRLVSDPPVRADQLLGKVIAVAGDAGWTPPGPFADRSLVHRIVRAVSTRAVIGALYVNVSAARLVERLLRSVEKKGPPIIRRLFPKRHRGTG